MTTSDFIGSENLLDGRVTDEGADHVRVDTVVGEIYM